MNDGNNFGNNGFGGYNNGNMNGVDNNMNNMNNMNGMNNMNNMNGMNNMQQPMMDNANNFNQGYPQNNQMNNQFNNGVNNQQMVNNMNPNMNPNMNQNYNSFPANNGGYGMAPTNKNSNKNLIVGLAACGGVLIVVILLVVLVMNLVGGKKLTCTMEDEANGMTMTSKTVYYFKNDKETKANGTMTIKFDEPFEEEQYENFKEMFEQDDDDVEVKVTKQGNKTIKVTMKENIDKDDARTYSQIKKSAENSGQTCK